ncbi:uncharacterized protein LOC134694971 [Mytilus trossulus]|uniref:uncharacterized protein LOC134694971 n=1 Tax=Mytilus trossulus TaxID=6551 RepID=UPI003004D0C1
MDIISMLCIYCFLFLTTVVEIESIRCYECTSQFTSSCGKDFKLKSSDTNYITNDQCKRCLKRITIQPNITVYSRECSGATVDGCNTVSPQEEQCFCQTDLCNKSSNMTVTIATVIINTMLFFILR